MKSFSLSLSLSLRVATRVRSSPIPRSKIRSTIILMMCVRGVRVHVGVQNRRHVRRPWILGVVGHRVEPCRSHIKLVPSIHSSGFDSIVAAQWSSHLMLIQVLIFVVILICEWRTRSNNIDVSSWPCIKIVWVREKRNRRHLI